MCSLLLSAQDIEGFVNRQMQSYPKSRLLDLYKSCFQDFMGAEHLVSDRQRVKAYLDEELNTTTLNELMPWNYEPCGIDSNYYRVSIRTVKENVISEDMLLDAFIRSANSEKRPSVETWRERWHKIIGTIDRMNLSLPHYQDDKSFIDSILSVGKYAISHSPEYREAYHPHYRIVERDIFERALKPLIEKTKTNDMKEKEEGIPQYFYSEKEIEKISAYIEKQYGKFDVVGHEWVSPDIHCDIAIVPPTEVSPYYKLVTMGAGAYKMNIPLKWKSVVCNRAEYVIFLPKDWNLESDKEEDYWPIRMLKTIARLVVGTDSWLGYCHTVQLTKDGSPVAGNTDLNSCVLTKSIGKDGQEVKPFKFGLFGKEVAFYQIYPLYPEETDFILKHSFDELTERLDIEHTLVIDIHRKNACK